MEYRIAAIPTVYNGRQYRSRLEAKWAAFFDLLGWRFEYEPADFGKWSPDFLLFCENVSPIFVEVKPIDAFDWPTAQKMISGCPRGAVTHIMLVGTAPFQPLSGPDFGSDDLWTNTGTEIGWCAYADPDHNRSWSGFFIAKAASGRFDLFTEYPAGAITQEAQLPDNYPPFGWMAQLSELREMWAKACNTVQWNRPR